MTGCGRRRGGSGWDVLGGAGGREGAVLLRKARGGRGVAMLSDAHAPPPASTGRAAADMLVTAEPPVRGSSITVESGIAAEYASKVCGWVGAGLCPIPMGSNTGSQGIVAGGKPLG